MKTSQLATLLRRLLVSAVFLGALPTLAQTKKEPKKIRGEVSVSVADDFAQHKSEHQVHVYDKASKKHIRLKLKSEKEALKFKTGQTIEVNGELDSAGELHLIGEPTVIDESSTDSSRTEPAGSQQKRNVLVILVNLQDGTAYRTKDTINTYMYAATNSVQHYFLDTTLGKINFYPDANGDSQPDIAGPVNVSLNGSGNCDYYGWATGAEAEATSLGFDLAKYQHRVFVLPGNTSCGWAGVANVNGPRSWVRSGGVSVYAHELGHNLGMSHASTDPENDGVINSEYGDASCVMGSSSIKYLNSPHMIQMGVLSGYSGKVMSASSGVMSLGSMGLHPNETPHPQILTLKKSDTNEYYYLSYRTKIGYDNNLTTTYLGGLNIHVYAGAGAAKTKFIKKLLPGEVFLDSKNGIEIAARTIASDALSMDVAVSGTCVGVNPTVSFTDTKLTVASGGSTSYRYSIRNNDSEFCGATTFSLTSTGPSGVSTAVSAASVSVSPGATVSGTLSVTANVADGTYSVSITANDNDGIAPSHNSASASATLVVGTTSTKGGGKGGGGGSGGGGGRKK